MPRFIKRGKRPISKRAEKICSFLKTFLPTDNVNSYPQSNDNGCEDRKDRHIREYMRDRRGEDALAATA